MEMIKNIPGRTVTAYTYWMDYFKGNIIKHHILQQNGSFFAVWSIFVALLILLILIKAFRISLIHGLMTIVLLVLTPLAQNITSLIAIESSFIIQMTMPETMTLSLLLCLIDFSKEYRRYEVVKKGCLAIIIGVMLYGNMLMISVDQHVLKQSKETTVSLMNRIMKEVESMHPSFADNDFVFLGRPADNPLFRKDETWYFSNDYAKYGSFGWGGNCCIQSYRGLLRDCGFNIKLNWDHNYWHELETLDDFQKMPCYPAERFVKEQDGHIFIKVS